MIIKEVGFRLGEEAFVESRFSTGVNILFSDDNNKGKTLVIQGMLYALGNDPVFPVGFKYKEATFYTKCEVGGVPWVFLRKNSSFRIHGPKGIFHFESVSELKRFYSKNISPLPEILKEGISRIVDPVLFFQIFALSQDKRNTSSLLGDGYYRKQDFLEMLYVLKNQKHIPSQDEIQSLKNQIEQLRRDADVLKRRLKVSKKSSIVAKAVLQSEDRKKFLEAKEEIRKTNFRISALDKERIREQNRVSKLERLINELLSLNKELNEGRVLCLDCGSSRIAYKADDFIYDVSNQEVRSQVLSSIKEQIALKNEIVEEKTRLINTEQTSLQKSLQIIPPTLQEIFIFSEEVSSVAEIDQLLSTKVKEIEQLLIDLDKASMASKDFVSFKSTLLDDLESSMNKYYKKINPGGIQYFEDLFTKSNETYSGSEEQEFYFSKLMALNEVLEHKYPIIIDSFRDGEISTEKESLMIEIFKGLEKQIILSATLKLEEYSSQKYATFEAVKAIDYSAHGNSHILNKEMLSTFNNIFSLFGIKDET